MTRAQAAAAATDQTGVQPSLGAMQAAAPAAASISERGHPTQTADQRDTSTAAEHSEEVQGGLPTSAQTVDTAYMSSHDMSVEELCHHTPDQNVLQPGHAAMASQAAPGLRRVEARAEGVQSIWSIFKRFSRRAHSES